MSLRPPGQYSNPGNVSDSVGLLAYGPKQLELYRQAGTMVGKVQMTIFNQKEIAGPAAKP